MSISFKKEEREYVKTSRILVVGAGVLGNETVKCLVLSGFSNISLVDMDKVEPGNLGRCVFFNYQNARERSYKVNAIREQISLLVPGLTIFTRVRNIEDMAEDFFQGFDIVLGCVDNIETRLHMNAHCYYYQIPFIDSGIDGSTGKVQVVLPPRSACLQCGMNDTHWRELQKRFTCTGERNTFYNRQIETNIITASMTAALQVNEAIRVLEGKKNKDDRNILFFNGEKSELETLILEKDTNCIVHS